MCILHRAISDTRHAHDSYECVSLSLSFATHCIRLKSARTYRNNTILCLHRKKEDHKSCWLFDTATREKDDSSVKLVSKTRGGEKAPVDKRRVERYFFLWAFISRNVA